VSDHIGYALTETEMMSLVWCVHLIPVVLHSCCLSLAATWPPWSRRWHPICCCSACTFFLL